MASKRAVQGNRVVVVCAAILSGIAIWIHPRPFAWVFTFWAVVAALNAADRPSLRFFFVNAAAALATLGAVEVWWGRVDAAPGAPRASSPTYDPSYMVLDDTLGYRPVAPSSVASRRVLAQRTVYDVRYNIDQRGLRVSPPCDCGEETRALLFFGCSISYGEGVADEETLPYRTGVRTGGRYDVYNFGFHGYGPHQMLAALERGVVAVKVEHPPRFVFYTAIVDHARRAAGRASWDRSKGPRYVLDDGGLRYAGAFKDSTPVGTSGLREGVVAVLRKSKIVARVLPTLGRGHEAETFAAIVDAARRRIELDFPGAEFVVLFWGVPSIRQTDLVRRLERRGLSVIEVSDLLDGYAEEPGRYEIEGDGHPNPLAYDRIAQYLAERVIGGR